MKLKNRYSKELALLKKKRHEVYKRMKALSNSPEDDFEYFELGLWLWQIDSLIRQVEHPND